MTGTLAVRGLSVSFGGLLAVENVDLDVALDSVTGLIGPNGAGKTTTIDALCGFVAAHGTVMLGSRRLEGLEPHERARAGLARTFQSIELFDDLTVAENVQVAASIGHWWSTLLDLVAPFRSSRRVDVARLLELVGVPDLAAERPQALSHGQRRLVSVARALATGPRLLLLDEPAAGLDPNETVALAGLLRRLPATGVGVLLVDHDMSLVLDVCRDLVVLDVGSVIASGPTATVASDPAVTAAYLGNAT
ncbi:MAG: ABC transporter ATP-binding protein [Actinobacteria bacterium]|nr:ABC transporter ATP-binding protein [Actinomycetota bacterium]